MTDHGRFVWLTDDEAVAAAPEIFAKYEAAPTDASHEMRQWLIDPRNAGDIDVLIENLLRILGKP